MNEEEKKEANKSNRKNVSDVVIVGGKKQNKIHLLVDENKLAFLKQLLSY